MKTKRNHFTPKCRLREFSTLDDSLIGYNVKNGRFIKRKYSNFGYEKYLYSQDTENLLAKYDSIFAEILTKLKNSLPLNNNKKSEFDLDDICKLATCLSIQVTRTPEAKKRTIKNAKKAKKLTQVKYPPIPELELFRKEYFDPQNIFERNIDLTSRELFKLLTSYNWRFIEADENYGFILNDIGFAIVALSLSGENKHGLGFESLYSRKIFPLTKSLCLIINSTKTGIMEKKDKKYCIECLRKYPLEKVKIINGLVLANASMWAFGHSKKILEDAILEKTKILEITKKKLEMS